MKTNPTLINNNPTNKVPQANTNQINNTNATNIIIKI